MSVKIKYFVHGTTTDNQQKLATGWLPGELSEKGIEQALTLGNIIKDEQFDVVICSDLKRAIDSARLVFKDRDIEIFSDARIRECNYGDYDGKSSELANYLEHINIPFPNGESMHDVEKRILSFLTDLMLKYDNKKVAIVAHKAPQLAIEVLTLNKTWEQAIESDWRITHNWQPGWEYEVKNIIENNI